MSFIQNADLGGMAMKKRQWLGYQGGTVSVGLLNALHIMLDMILGLRSSWQVTMACLGLIMHAC